jgi:hypothetical protein
MCVCLCVQIVPQILNYVTQTTASSLDFASIFIYTCTASCELKDSLQYVLEYAWAQVDDSKMLPRTSEEETELK